MPKVIIAGGRDFNDEELMDRTMKEFYRNTELEIVSGNCEGADELGKLWACEYGLDITIFKADKELDGQFAKSRKEQRMAEYADELVAFWDGESLGTKNIIHLMSFLGKPVVVIPY